MKTHTSHVKGNRGNRQQSYTTPSVAASQAKPTPHNNFAAIPAELKKLPRWVNWQFVERDGKSTKVPVDPNIGHLASSSDPDTWGTYADALARFNNDSVDGIGFQLGDSYVGIDLDRCRNPKTGEIESRATEIIGRLSSYAEISPSGTGVHILTKGTLPPHGRRKGPVEIYSVGRFFTMTGQHLDGTPTTVEERQSELTELHAQIFGTGISSGTTTGGTVRAVNSLADDEIIDRARNAKNGEKFVRLWSGDYAGYHSPSEGDLALCMMLAFWTGRDAVRVDSLFRLSKLFRPKWDERRSADGRTYGELTVEKAIDGTREVWNQPVATPNGGGGGSADPGLIKELADAISSEHKFAQDRGGWLYRYADGVYKPDGEGHVKRTVKFLLESWGQTKRWSSGRADEVVEYLRVDSPLIWERPPLDTVNVANGLLDIETGKLKSHTSDFLSPVQLPVSYDPTATCPAWEKFVSEVFPDDAQELAWEVPAWLMTPEISIQKALLLLGEGANGKSVYLSALRAFLGRTNAAAESLHRLESDRFAVAQLVGKLANICPDLPSSSLSGSSMFKAITGGDFITAEYKFKQPFEFQPHSRLVFSANFLPRSNDASHAYFRRWLIVPFTHTFDESEQIPREVLDARLAAPSELSGLMNKAVVAIGAIRQRRGFTEAKSVSNAGREFVRLTDPVAVWLDAMTRKDPEAMVAKQTFLEAYNTTARKEGRAPITQTALSLAVKRLVPGIQDGQRKVAGVKKHVWLGIELLDEKGLGTQHSDD
jgi:putative DNA primase/helicase